MLCFGINARHHKRALTALVGFILLSITCMNSAFSVNNTDVVTGIITINSSNTVDVAADIQAGEKLYVRCIACHSPSYHRTGPKHCGIFGKVAGSDTDFIFTDAMKNSEIIWNAKTLDEFLSNPLKKVPGSSMGFSGINSAKERQQLIAFLRSLSPENEKCE